MMQVESVAQAVSNLAIQFGDSDDDAGVMSRPFGVAILFAGMDDNGTQLYHMDPRTYDEKMQVESVAQAVSNLAIQFGDSDDDAGVMSRPFGVAILFAGLDDNGPQLYHMDPSG